MDQIFGILQSSIAASQASSELNGRSVFVQRAIVTNTDDPENMRRIKVSLASKGGQLESNWLQRCNLFPSQDEPLPKRGQTVLVSFVDGNPHDGVYFGVLTNQPNPALGKDDAIADSQREIEGKETAIVEKDYTVKCGKSIKLQNDAGAYIELNEAGFVRIGDAFGHTLVLGTGTNNADCSWNLGGASLDITNIANFRILGNQVATIGAIDSDGDVLQTRGW